VTRIGVISDTHGFLDPRVLELFGGADHIVHAGDIVDPAILGALALVAPVTAVVGNLDADMADELPTEAAGEVDGICFVVGHKRKRLMKRLTAGKIDCPGGAMPDLVVFGHEHVASASWVEGALFLNPGSASAPYEEDDTPTVAIVETGLVGLSVTFVPLERRQWEGGPPRLRPSQDEPSAPDPDSGRSG
jgi:putative phosphoesterase